ncbi:hypothetical protein [Mucilaginibacter sp. KACC 22063]|uniref:hypothetical protein n=1 Tax=Mucilaginibacter sp. KACC 22063 TaxID=3025666 RepID=UPI002365CA2C|nr:hypothetical protein [Mucilaginibacter sp. KACC 22063]WDF53644.1 hypothetical protein PQ461_11880 [Mucilaginibacter sp. KACC 22063]
MIPENENVQDPKDEKDIANNSNTEKDDDTLGDNTGDASIQQGNEPNVQDKPDDVLVPTVTPDHDNGEPGPSGEQPVTNSSAEQPVTETSSNKGQGPSGENL